jgi:hypothetical protein
MVEKPNFPLLLHSESSIMDEYNSSKELLYQKLTEAHLQQLQLVSSQFDQSVARDKPKAYALSKLNAATKNKTILMMMKFLCFLTQAPYNFIF